MLLLWQHAWHQRHFIFYLMIDVAMTTLTVSSYFLFRQPPLILVHLTDETVIAGRPVQFRCHCQLDGHSQPLPSVEWRHNGLPLTIDRAFASVGEESCVLRVNDVEERDGGEYMCSVTNEMGVATSSARLTVLSESINHTPINHTPFKYLPP